MAADLSLARSLSTSCPLRFSLKMLLGGSKGSVLLGCSYSAEEILTQLLSALFLMQPLLNTLQAPSQYSRVVMLHVGCLVAPASICCGAGVALWPCLLIDILAKPTPGLLRVLVMASPGAGDSPTLTLPSPTVPSAGLEAWLGALSEISPIQIDREAL